MRDNFLASDLNQSILGIQEFKDVEVSIAGEGQIGKTKIQLLGGYTYTKPYIEDIHHQYDEYIIYKNEFNPDLGTMDTVAVSNPFLTTQQVQILLVFLNTDINIWQNLILTLNETEQ